MLYKVQNNVIKFLDDYNLMIPKANYKTIHEKGIQISTHKQMLQRLPVALAQVKVGNKSEFLFNEIHQISCSPYQAKGIAKKVHNIIMNPIKF